MFHLGKRGAPKQISSPHPADAPQGQHVPSSGSYGAVSSYTFAIPGVGRHILSRANSQDRELAERARPSDRS